jgi:uncharacterized LabA/DUF88 family protein
MNRTVVYVDGFNLYYGALRRTSLRWLDIAELCRLMLPSNDVQRINYYTALVSARRDDPEQPVRQQMYLRALATLPQVRIHLGHFLGHEVWMPVVDPAPNEPKFARVMKTEEKGSDVNLATHLVSDAYEDRFDVAVVISNDSDLLAPVRLAKQHLRKRVGVLNPQQHPALDLAKAATFFKQIREGALRASQFPIELRDAKGPFKMPAQWSVES